MRHNFTDTPWKDHKIISLDLSDGSEKGQGQCYLNIELLRDPNFVREINEKWVDFSHSKTNFSSVSEWWDRAIEMVKNIAIIFSINKKQVQSELDIFFTKIKIKTGGFIRPGPFRANCEGASLYINPNL